MYAKTVGCPEDISKLKDCLKSKKMMEIVKGTLTITVPFCTPVIDNIFLEGKQKKENTG